MSAAPEVGKKTCCVWIKTHRVFRILESGAHFTPLRHNVQDAIDQRFYRRKYDVAKVLAVSSLATRDEVELERLTGELLNVASEAMQPTSVSLWLRPMVGRNASNGEKKGEP